MPLSEYAEWMAKRIVSDPLDVTVIRLDQPDAGILLCDYELVSSNGRKGVLEATTCTDQDLIGLHVAMRDREIIPAPSLRNTWWIWLARDARMNQLRGEIVEVLEQVESEDWGAFVFGDNRRWPYHLERADGTVVAAQQPQPVLAARRLGVKSAHRASAEVESQIVLNPPTQSARAHPENVVEAAELETRQNAEKLAAADSSYIERHLFIWVDTQRRFDVEFSISAEGAAAQARPPDLPEGTTHLWIAADANYGHHLRGRETADADVGVWYSEGGDRWQATNVDIPMDERPTAD